MRFHRVVLVAVGLVGAGLAGCSSGNASNLPGLANPASVYCVEQGGEVDIVEETDGEVGYCNLPDGSRVEEWELYRSRDSSP
ncbi:DUF333 domain-containing protein [Ilumatobacter sp.]|uniref:putative hemolysin n=1 Tax=uncultured Ilumatobacter sp. TaxID=879968 RepID=UPI00374E4491|nr:DUF333 domain-containing protein [Ilumatobacter sp.]